jgi:predicted phage terminase large subunit-like protein
MMPPRSGKSELSSRNFPAWLMGHHPDWEIIAASHTTSLALSFSRYIRDTLLDPAYQVLFPDTKLDPKSQSVENWNTTKGGGYLASGVGSAITGRGAHVLILDDLVKDQEGADSETITQNTWEWYGSTAYTRLAPGGGVLGLMTWWSQNDWAGRIQEAMKSEDGEQFEIVKYPAINEEGDEYLLPDDNILQFPDGTTPPEGSRLTRPHNTAIHPERYNLEALLRIKRNLIATGQRRVWQALYQQNPLPDEGLVFTKDMIRWGNFERRSDYNVFQAWDFAITEKKLSDWIVCCTLLQDTDDNLIVSHIRRFKSDDGIAIVEAILDEYEAHRPNAIGFEDGQIWKSIKSLFEKRCRERKLYPSHTALIPLTDKIVRAGPLKGRMQMGKFYIQNNRSWNEAYLQELLFFPGGKHDDQVDSTAWAVRLALEHTPQRQESRPKEKSWKDKIPGLTKDRGASHMSA